MDKPLIVQGDRTLLLDVHSPLASECRASLLPFAELEKSPEHLHTYRLTPLSLWNARAAGFCAEDAVAVLQKYAKFDLPPSVIGWIHETASRFGAVVLTSLPEPFVPEGQEGSEKALQDEKKLEAEYLYLYTNSDRIKLEISSYKSAAKLLTPFKDGFALLLTDRGTVKEALLLLGYPVKDEAPLREGDPFPVPLRQTCAGNGEDFAIRSYQIDAADCLVGNMGAGSGFGVIVLPCGSGKTVVGIKIMNMLGTNTLILTTNITALRQWKTELLDKTLVDAGDICEYSGEKKMWAP
ncbi:MAG: hypothetical protein Ta2A_27370 [Treponemataceae bacterium]|nr:MAG: hypothetical protein Ta2A_27370 [Treponemataceae bacterium]